MKKNTKINFIQSIGGKILIIFVLMSIISIIGLSIVFISEASKSLREQTFNQLESIQQIKKNQIENYFSDLINLMDDVQTNLRFIDGIALFRDIFPNGINSDEYIDLYDKRFPGLNTFEKVFGFYDVFLIDLEGNIVFTVEKEDDWGTNLVNGEFKSTGLAKAFEQGKEKTSIIDFEWYDPSNEPASFLSTPLRDSNGKLIGVAAFQISLEQINDIMQENSGMGETGGSYLVGEDYLMRSDSDLDHTPMTVKESFEEKIEMDTASIDYALEGKTGQHIIIIEVDGEQQPILSSYSSVTINNQITWAMVADIDEEEINEPINALIFFIIITTVIILSIIIIVAFIFSRSISRPISSAVLVADSIAEKDLTKEIENKYLKKKDETGQLSRALVEMKESLTGMVQDLTNGVNSIASSATELSTISEEMSKGAVLTTDKTNTVASAAEEMNTNIVSVASGMEQTSTNISGVASAAEEMNTTIGQIAQNTEKARTITEDAVKQSESVSNRMNELGVSALEIGKVTETITSISAQTNLLALNATIEAARAGTAGKGFAVVAGEIKELAQKTATATEDIKDKIQGIQNATNMTINDIQEIGKIIKEVNDIVSTIAAAIEEQTITTKDITRNMNEASLGVTDASKRMAQSAEVTQSIAKDIADVSLSAQNISGNTVQINSSAKELSKLSEQLKTMIEQYKL